MHTCMYFLDYNILNIFLLFYFQDVLISRFQAKVADSKLTLKLKHARKICDEAFKAIADGDSRLSEISANSLEGVAKGRYVLTVIADYLYRCFIEGDSSFAGDLDVRRETMLLLKSAKQLCTEGPSTTPQLYLVKQLVRRYGFDCVRTLGGYQELEWILPPEAHQQVR